MLPIPLLFAVYLFIPPPGNAILRPAFVVVSVVLLKCQRSLLSTAWSHPSICFNVLSTLSVIDFYFTIPSWCYYRPTHLLFAADYSINPPGNAILRRGRVVRLGANFPTTALLRLHCWELEEERLWEVMSAMALHDKVYIAAKPSEADAVLALRSKLKSNPGLRGAAREAGVPIYAIKSSSTANLVKAFRTLLGVDPSAGGVFTGVLKGEKEVGEGESSGDSTDGEMSEEDEGAGVITERTVEGRYGLDATRGRNGEGMSKAAVEGLEEVQLAVENLVVPCGQLVELLPRSEAVRQQQAALAARYGLKVEVVGEGEDARLRVLPKGVESSQGSGPEAGEEQDQQAPAAVSSVSASQQ